MGTSVSNQKQSIHEGTTVGELSLTVSDLDRSVAFYSKEVGFRVLSQSQSEATLGVDKPLLHLTERPDASAWPRGGRSYTGLYHFAILLPTRADLGAWVKHWLELGHPVGQGDHIVSEALYLEDPDGHGIEIYRDRPRGEWTWTEGRVVMGAGPVDIRGMIAEAEQEGKIFEGLPRGTRLGHMHLQVGDIPEAEAFYCDVLGFDIVASMPTALFVSAGGYHHHIGMNVWHSSGASSAPETSVRLNHFTIDLKDESALADVLQRLRDAGLEPESAGRGYELDDPWGNHILLRVVSDG